MAQRTFRQLKPVERAEAYGLASAGTTYAEVTSSFGVHSSTISRIINKADDPNNEFQSTQQSGLRKTTKRQDQRLQQEARKGYTQRRQPLAELHHKVALEVSHHMIQRRLYERDRVQKHRATEQLALAPKHKKECLE